ncbi:MAG: hypothetical protein V1244_01720, partial [Nitrospinaceae bacterium]|nr:hypothetical protein [Nitrospinaceae bacterium]
HHALGIGFALGAHAGEPGEEPAEQKPEPAIPSVRLPGDAGVYEEMRDPPGLQPPEEIGPNLGLDEHHRPGPDGGQGAPDKSATVDRIVNPSHLGGELFSQLAHCRGGGCGDDHLEVGQSRLENLDQLHTDVRLADTNRMQPNDIPVADGLLELGGITAQSLPKTPAPAPPASHSKKIIGR